MYKGGYTRSTSCFQHGESNLLPVATFGQHVESNMLKATCCLRQLLGNFSSTCWKQLVESNLLPAATYGQLWSTCWKQHVESNLLPAATFGQLLGNMLKATCWKQLVAWGNFRTTFGKHVAFNKLLSTCCPCVAGFRNVLCAGHVNQSRKNDLRRRT